MTAAPVLDRAHRADPAAHTAHRVRPIVIRPAPPLEPPFDDELSEPIAIGRFDQRLPFRPEPAPVAGRRPTLTRRPAGVPDPAPWTRRLLVGLIESADGRRPLHQLAAMLSPSVGRGLGADFERAAATGDRHWLHRAGVQSVRCCEPADGVAEVSATVETGERVRAVAVRLEAHQGRWRCTRLQLG